MIQNLDSGYGLYESVLKVYWPSKDTDPDK